MRLPTTIVLLLLLAAVAPQPLYAESAVAFFYGEQPPVTELRAFDRVVIEPQNVDDRFVEKMAGTEVYAYVSLGEVDGSRSYLDAIPTSWRMGNNPAWGSIVIDQSRAEWPNFFVEQVITPLWKRGFRGFFLDTLDSYLLYAGNISKRASQQQGIIRTIRTIKKRYPEAKLFFNRGFELLPELHEQIDAVAAESLFYSWNALDSEYVEVKQQDREWLLAKLQEVRERYQLPVTVIDYLPAGERDQARITAEKIKALGFTPWISNNSLDMLGVGSVEVMPRKVLMLYDSADDETELMEKESVVLYGTMPLNYFGYSAEYHDAREPLPQFPMRGRYAGVVVWLQQSLRSSAAQRLSKWLYERKLEGVPILILGNIEFFDRSMLSRFDLQRSTRTTLSGHFSLTQSVKSIGYETPPLLGRGNFFPLELKQGTPWAVVEDDKGTRQITAAITNWGGYVLEPLAVTTLPGGAGDRWVTNPFTLFTEALRLPQMPVPDLTTDSGRRMVLVHMDGDGFASRAEFPGNPYAAKILLDKILKKFHLPSSISVIEGEVGSQGLYPELSKELEPIARSIYALPHIEMASHSYSHPFNWSKVLETNSDDVGEDYNLPIPNYEFNLIREVDGSINYIESKLAPPGKTVAMFFWTGNCNPTNEALTQIHMAGVGNINGGDTVMTRSLPTLTAVAPIGMQKGRYFQVFAPNQNENVYTNDWMGPFYGYRRVIETFKMTDEPRRLKPINIYYHTYSASKPSSLAALDEVYRWTLKQKITPVFTSSYVRKAQQFDKVVVARHGDGWRVRGMDAIRELRLPVKAGIPDMEQSTGIAGYNRHNDQRYIHTANESVELVTYQRSKKVPYLVSANAPLTKATYGNGKLRLSFMPQIALEVELANVGKCYLLRNGKRQGQSSRSNGITRLRLKKHVTGPIEAYCDS